MRATAGYILFESLVAMGLLSICMLAIYTSMRESALTRGLAEDYTTARFLMEQVALDQEIQIQVAEGEGSGGFEAPDDRFSYAWKISKVEVPMEALPMNLPENQRRDMEEKVKRFLGKLAVTIHWARAGVDHSVTGETLLRPGQLWMPVEKRK